MDELVKALAKITNDYKVIDALQALWPEGRLDLIFTFQMGSDDKHTEGLRIEAWPRNSTRGKALGKQHPYMYGNAARPDAHSTLGAWNNVLADVAKCKWKQKPSTVLDRGRKLHLNHLTRCAHETFQTIRENTPKGKTVIIQFRTPSATHHEDRFRRVRISLTPVEYLDKLQGDQAVGNGESVAVAARHLHREFQRINDHYEYAQKDAALTQRLKHAEEVLASAEPGDLIIQSEGYPTLILVEKNKGFAVKAQPLGRGQVIRYKFLSVQKTPRIVHNGSLTRKLLLAYARGREKLSEHVKVRVRQPCDMLAVRVGSKEFGFYLRRDYREMMSPFIMFTGS